MRILAIDPGSTHSGWLYFDTEEKNPIGRFGKSENPVLLEMLSDDFLFDDGPVLLVIEQVCSYGMAVGAEVFDTVFWSGRFAQEWEHLRSPNAEWRRIPRLAVKKCICHNGHAKDPNIRQVLIDRFGGKERGIGNKKNPGPLYGISKDVWAALALAITAAEQAP